MTDITGLVNLVLLVCVVAYLTRLRATLTRSADAQERIAQALERMREDGSAEGDALRRAGLDR